jgi:hypothetical protein
LRICPPAVNKQQKIKNYKIKNLGWQQNTWSCDAERKKNTKSDRLRFCVPAAGMRYLLMSNWKIFKKGCANLVPT